MIARELSIDFQQNRRKLMYLANHIGYFKLWKIEKKLGSMVPKTLKCWY